MLQMCGPTGIGFLYGKIDLLSAMPPFLGMSDEKIGYENKIASVRF